MKKYIWLLGLCAILFTSCSPKINGATPHRRDRHCGCENISHPNDTPCQAIDEGDYAYLSE